jgi:hypothetical protein
MTSISRKRHVLALAAAATTGALLLVLPGTGGAAARHDSFTYHCVGLTSQTVVGQQLTPQISQCAPLPLP